LSLGTLIVFTYTYLLKIADRTKNGDAIRLTGGLLPCNRVPCCAGNEPPKRPVVSFSVAPESDCSAQRADNIRRNSTSPFVDPFRLVPTPRPNEHGSLRGTMVYTFCVQGSGTRW